MTDTIISENTTGTYIGDYSGTKTARLSEGDPTGNYNTGSDRIDGRTGGIASNSLYRFTGLSNISASDIASSVIFALWKETSNTASVSLDFHRLLLSFTDTSVTWNTRDGINNWNSGGALGNGSDRVTSASISMTMTNVAQYHTATDSSGTFLADIQGFIDGTYSNHGHGGYTTDTTAYRTITSDSGVDGQRPALVVTHAAGGGTSWLTTNYWWDSI